MSSVPYTGARLLIDGYDIAADFTDLTLNYSSASLDNTTFGSTTRTHQGGLRMASLSGKGLVNLGSSSSDSLLFANVGTAIADLVTVFPVAIVENATSTAAAYAGYGYAMNGVQAKYNFGTQVGSLLPFDVDIPTASDLVRAIPLKDFTSLAASSGVTNTTPFTRLYAATCEQVYAGLHVTAISTGSVEAISAILQSASSSGFGTTTNQVTFSAMTCKIGSFATPVLPSAMSTDRPFWRAQITTCGSTIKGLIWVGIGPRIT